MFKNVKVDTLYLVATMTREQFNKHVKENFSVKRVNNYYEYIYTDKEQAYSIKYNPLDELGRPNHHFYKRQHWNIKLELQNQTLKNMPQNIKRLLQNFDWYVNQIELAFNFNSPITKHFSYISSNVKVIQQHKDKNGGIIHYGLNYYIYSKKSKQQSLVYDKKNQLSECKDIEIDDKYLTRYEITIKPTKKEQIPIHLLQFDWIDNYLSKFLFIPNIDEINIGTNTRNLMQKIMRRKYKDLKHISDRDKRKIRKIVMENKFDFRITFYTNMIELFDWIPAHEDQSIS